MNFINEYVPQEDIDRFNLDALWNRFNPDSNPLPSSMFHHYWTVDREANCWFIYLTLVKDIEESDTNLPLYTNEYIFILHYKNIDIEIHLIQDRKNGSQNFKESPFNIIWELKSISSKKIDEIEIKTVLKKALKKHGYNGIRREINNTIVHCKF